jgi:hypothetical protein
VFDRNVAVVSGCVESVDDPVPVELPAAGYAIAPPSGVGGRGPSYRLAEDPVARACSLVDLDVLGLDVADQASLERVFERVKRVDAELGQMGGVVGEAEAETGHPVP